MLLLRTIKKIKGTTKFLTGSYDKTAKLIDYKASQILTSFNHDSPIEDIAVHPSGINFVTVGG